MIPRNAVLIALVATAGCVSTTTHPGEEASSAGLTPTTPPTTEGAAAAVENIDENLARLRALAVFQVGDLIVDQPEEAGNCYGPCPGADKLVAAAKEKAAVRLAHLSSAAEVAAPESATASCDKATIDKNLAALQGLRIVQIASFLEEAPKNNPSCYNLPCPEDVAAAKATTCERAAKLAGIVTVTKDL
jgi:hypothetical protein